MFIFNSTFICQESFVCRQLYGSKYSNLIQIIYIQLYGFKCLSWTILSYLSSLEDKMVYDNLFTAGLSRRQLESQ